VSDNPDHSGIHNYYLMTFVEQGLPGFLIWMALCFALLIYAEKAYHKYVKQDVKHMLMAAALSLFVIFTLLLINDLLETDKVGSLFFLSAAIITYYNFFHEPENSKIQVPQKV
jgi:O-antigen ligase